MEKIKIKINMKKIKFSVIALTVAGSSLFLNSCIGSFSLTNSVLQWNKKVSSKAVNELVFITFWILPVYEVTAIADLLVLNSIEFWSGSNPVSASTKVIDTEQGRYLVDCDGKGYTITHENTGRETRLEFEDETQTWSLIHEDDAYPFMTFLDDSHVKMITPEGDFRIVELTEEGVMAYSISVTGNNALDMAMNLSGI